MKISFIATVYNEEKTIGALLESVVKQSRLPSEVIIIDGGSSDKTLESIKYYVLSIKGEKRFKNIQLKIIEKKGNRAVGRNEAIRQATGDVIVCSDAGCVLNKDWVKNITAPFGKEKRMLKQVQHDKSRFWTSRGRPNGCQNDQGKTDVVAGFYAARPQSIFEKCLVPYVLVMPDRVDPSNFLPATRSMAFTKKIWEKAGEFPEGNSHNEDYVFARRLRDIGAKMVFAKEAVVYWQPRKNLKEAFVMFFRFAYGDAEAGILRPKVAFLFARYLIGILLVISYLVFRSPLLLATCYVLPAVYVVWSIAKSYKYVLHWQAILILPILQVTADIAVMLGTIWGTQHKR